MNLIQDLRFAIRLLIKDKWFTAVAVIALAAIFPPPTRTSPLT